MSQTTVSVIIPTYNRSHVLADALQSVREQSYQDFEVIIVDDHSDDNEATKQLVLSLRDERFKYVYLKSNKGPSGVRNAALPLCTGKLISFLDSDDLWRSRKLEVHTAILQNNPDVAMVYSDEYVLSETGRVSEKPVHMDRNSPLPSGYIAREFFEDSFIGVMTVTLRRSVFEEMGGFDESMLYNEDDDLWFRIMLKYKVVCSDYVSGIRRLHETNMSRDRSKMVYYQLQCISKYFDCYPDFMKQNHDVVSRKVRSLLTTYFKWSVKSLNFPSLRVIGAYTRVRNHLKQSARQIQVEHQYEK